MKKETIYFATILFIAISFNYNIVYSQSSSAGAFNLMPLPNTPFAPGVDFLGWAAGTGLPVTIKNEDPLSLEFHTNTGAGGIINMHMRILGGYNAASGLIGMGDMNINPLVPYTPNYLLDSYRTGNTDVFHQFPPLLVLARSVC